jgi:SpoIID/LytB domain protein
MRRGPIGLTTAILSTLLVAVGPTASPAAASTTYPMPATGKVTVQGHGYGHGHGMSQYGAEGAALGGPTWAPQTWQDILAFYYPGTTRSAYARTIRVKISADTSRDVAVEPRTGLAVAVNATNEIRRLPLNGATRWRLEVASGNQTAVDYLLNGTWTRWWTFAGDGAFGASGQPMRLYYNGSSHQFRGRLSAIRPTATSTDRDTINILSLEDYLRGVVPAEMPASWHVNAVSSQAVAARTYAAYLLQHPPASYYDICDTTSCQVYGGYDSEHPNSNAAIDATKGVILTAAGAPAFTQFSSSSGGWTSAGSFAYLPARQDPYDAWRRDDGTPGNANHDWSIAIDVARIEKAWGISDLKSIEVTARDGNGDWGGRVEKLVLHGAVKNVTVYGSNFRTTLGLKSTYFTLVG